MDRLKSIKRKLRFTQFLSFICTFAPLIIFIIMGFINGEIHKSSKVFLGFTVIMAVLLTIINILFKYHLRSPLFILLLGIYVALDKILFLLIIISIGIIIDEFILRPIIKKLKNIKIVREEMTHGS